MRATKQRVMVVLHKDTVLTSTYDVRRGAVPRCWRSVTYASLHRVYALLMSSVHGFGCEASRSGNRVYLWERPLNTGDYVYDARKVVRTGDQLPVQAASEAGQIRNVTSVNGDRVTLVPVVLVNGYPRVSGPAYAVWRHEVDLVHVDLIPVAWTLTDESMSGMQTEGFLFAERAG